MKVTRILPFRPLCHLLPTRLAGLSIALLKATALELAILAGHLLLYPSGVLPERRQPLALPPKPSPSPSTTTTTTTTTTTATTTATATATATTALSTTPLTDAPRPPAAPPDTAHLPTPAKPPVLLLHGFIDNRSVFVLLRRSLAQHGRQQVESLNYSPLTCDIRTAAALLARHVEELCERTGRERIDVVGHSLGGLIARYYVQRLGGDKRVRILVTLGTPHAGTRIARLADAHPIVRQMRPGSSVVEELKQPAPGCRTRFVSFWSDLDQLMVPLETACVDHPDLLVQNVRVTGIGHLALPVHPAVATGIRQALDASAGEEARAAGSVGGLTVA
ncbi:alpha/beta fold hydrolase [Streptomyces sp. SID14478]|uniref:alpha/beta fold hydrolase n=1 Tax=Streptomyces sp. SID14478 TaxID=2706073 RepID=UPI0013DF8A95|nr:alpha/beta fold hydrolase [Streptomyces sp. SID14478]